jgi:hypothetical protein
MKTCCCIIVNFLLTQTLTSQAQDSLDHKRRDTLRFSGQLSTWVNYNSTDVPLWLGGRYLPQLNYDINLREGRRLDFEVSANINGQSGFTFSDSISSAGRIAPYRAWVRYSTEQLEIRAGLQKINFGSASILRPLMWFEIVDPRDPLQITIGVWGVLGRYYFLNNQNIWLWGLYGNHDPKTWEVGGTTRRRPEFGGRFQSPVPRGEAGITFHHRQVDTRGIDASIPGFADVSENRLGLDGKWDLGVGLWFEGSWINKRNDVGLLTNQLIANVGTDYTFGIGNGVNVIFEQLLIAYDRKPFDVEDPVFFSALSLNYPVGLFDNIGAMLYYNWLTNQTYNLVNWKRQFNSLYLYIIAFWNPDVYVLPQQQRGTGNTFAGKGIQVMFVFNH